MRSLLLTALALCSPLAACGPSGPAAEAAPFAARSVWVLVADSLPAAHLSSYGHARATTPHLDRLAARGVRFETAYSQSPWTLPSVASLFTSLEQERHGVRNLDDALGSETATLAELFAAGGWRTVAFVQTPVLASRAGLGRGFERYRVLPYGEEGLERALELARRELGASAPTFLYLHLTPPHMPYQPPEPFRGRFTPPGGEVDGSIASCRRIHRAGLPAGHPDVLRLEALYDEHVAYADALLGGLLEEIERLPPARRPLVVFTSDHGEAFMEHGSQGHNASVHEEMVRVPLLFAGPGLEPRVADATASLLDLAPTLADLCGLERPSAMQGRSLAPWIQGSSAAHEGGEERRDLFLSSRYRGDLADLQLGLRRGRFKLILTAGGARLFDLERDPAEIRDVATEHPALAAAMERDLRAWHAARRPPSRAAAPAAPSTQSELERMGYAGE